MGKYDNRISRDGVYLLDGCGAPRKSLGLCSMHYQRRRKTGDVGGLEPLLQPRTGAACSVEGCEKAESTKRLCQMHYARWVKSGDAGSADPLRARTATGMCEHDGCTRPYYGKGLRWVHYLRTRRHGDPDVVLRECGGTVDYGGAHQRVHRVRGKASTHACVDCGKPAYHWAYKHDDPDELMGMTPSGLRPYSLNIDSYQPMCVSCHKVFDLNR
jgi:hypothetical protein